MEKVIEWEGDRPLKELVFELINLIEDGYTEVNLFSHEEEIDLNTADGAYDIDYVPKLKVK